MRPGVRSLSMALALVAGCADTGVYDLDASVSDAAIVEARRLEIVGEPMLSLSSGQTAQLTVRLLDPGGAPMAGEQIRFALDGRAHDSTLGATSVATDAEGLARTTLRAGTVVSAFRVRASSDDAASISFDVAVSDAGFGQMQVTPLYQGERDRLPRVVVGVFLDSTCEHELVRRDPGDRIQVHSQDDELVRFLGLPAGMGYAVAVRGESDEGTVLAWGCVDGVTVNEGESTDVSGPFDDEPLVTEGSYETTTTFGVSGTRARLADALVDARGTLLAANDGTLLLGEAERQLTEAGDPEAALLRDARDAGADAAYQTLLVAEGVGPSAAHAALVQHIRTELDSLSILGRLRATGGELELSVRRLGFRSGSVDVELAELLVPAALDATLTSEGLTVSSLRIELGATTAVTGLAARAAEERSLATPSEWLAAQAGCAMLPAPTTAIGCDAACLEAACRAVIDGLWEDTLAALAPLDAERAALELAGSAEVSDTLYDLQVDTLEGQLSGEWTGPAASDAEAIEGALAGQRITPPR